MSLLLFGPCPWPSIASTMGRRPLPAVRDFTRDGRWSTYDVSVCKKLGGKWRKDRLPSIATISNKSRTAVSFSKQVGRLASPVFYVYVFSLVHRRTFSFEGSISLAKLGLYLRILGPRFCTPTLLASPWKYSNSTVIRIWPHLEQYIYSTYSTDT